MNIDYRLIGSRIKEKRKLQGFTQEKLAEGLDVTVGYVSQIERGISKISLDLLAAISVILHCNVAELISETAPKSEHYLTQELTQKIDRLSAKDKKLLTDFVDLLLNR